MLTHSKPVDEPGDASSILAVAILYGKPIVFIQQLGYIYSLTFARKKENDMSKSKSPKKETKKPKKTAKEKKKTTKK